MHKASCHGTFHISELFYASFFPNSYSAFAYHCLGTDASIQEVEILVEETGADLNLVECSHCIPE